MSPPSLLVFDDGQGSWGPLSDLRAIFEVRTGAVTSLLRINRVLGMTVRALFVPDRLADVVRHRQLDIPVNEPLDADCSWLLVNGRWPGVFSEQGITLAQSVRTLPLGSAIVQPDQQLIAAHLTAAQARSLLASHCDELPSSTTVEHRPNRVLLDRPWQIIDGLEKALLADLEATELPESDGARYQAVCFGSHRLCIASDAIIQPHAVFNTQQGPIVVDAGAQISTTAVLEGPCYIGRKTHVGPHTLIRPNTVVGPVCKVRGEISCTIFQGYTNKAHDGYLGHCLVGQWVNLGAGTCVSNLKNTYGQVRMQLSPDTLPEDTGSRYLGPVVGDYVRTAIGTRLMTGSCIGTGAMIALSGFSPKSVDRFAFLTDAGQQTYQFDKFIGCAQTMMARRECELSQSEMDLIHALHS